MHRLREALFEAFITILIGGLIGAVLAVVSNLFIMGVQYLGGQREALDPADLFYWRPDHIPF